MEEMVVATAAVEAVVAEAIVEVVGVDMVAAVVVEMVAALVVAVVVAVAAAMVAEVVMVVVTVVATVVEVEAEVAGATAVAEDQLPGTSTWAVKERQVALIVATRRISTPLSQTVTATEPCFPKEDKVVVHAVEVAIMAI